jgi:GNAT superfamily N-acetyltransferase
MTTMNQKSHLLDLYRSHPCRTLPNAWWKTGQKLAALDVRIEKDGQGQPRTFAVWEDDRVLALWCREAADFALLPSKLTQAPMILAHANALDGLAGIPFSRREAYFRLVHQGTPPETTCPQGYHYADAEPTTEADAIAALIRACYPGSEMTAGEVQSWASHPVYDPALWVWVREAATDHPVGLGIAEVDPEIPEASLEWVQVHPDAQGKGLGKALVAELLRRVAGRTVFTTVSGQVDNLTQPERLYRRCGFSGSDIWWLLIK